MRENAATSKRPEHRQLLSGSARIDNRPALELTPTHPTRTLGRQLSETTGAVYVIPHTFAPIEASFAVHQFGQATYTTERWLAYRVLPDTSANLWRVSLIARHPHARIVRSASAYLQASTAGSRTEMVASG